jgi:hypothetical protein
VGGFFQYNPDSSNNFLSFRLGAFDNAATFIKWYGLNFGLLLPLGLVGLFYLKQNKIFFATLLVGSLIVFNFIDYDLSYDIIKFATIISITLAFLSSVTLSHLFRKESKLLLKVMGFVTLPLLISSGVSFALVAALNSDRSPLKLSDKAPIKLAQQDIQAVNWLRNNVAQKDIVLRMSRPASLGYAQWGGLVQAWVGIDGVTLGFTKEKLSQRLLFQSNLPSNPSDYLNVGVRWLVLTPWDKPFDNYIQQWLDDGDAKLQVEFAPLKIYELVDSTHK